jgi:hypothetical protein
MEKLDGTSSGGAASGGMLQVESQLGQGSQVMLTVSLHNLLGDTFVGLS